MKIREIILCKYGEIVLKGANRRNFEETLLKELRYRALNFGNFNIFRSQSTITIAPLDDNADIDGMLSATLKVYGIVGVSRCACAEKNMEEILSTVKKYVPEAIRGCKTFKVEASRSDKTFPLNSPQICAEAGGAVLEACPWIKVDVHNPDVVVKIEIRDHEAYIHAGQLKGAGGIPVGTGGRGMLLLSGGIDSPVAGCMMAKRGLKLEAVHFESFPYTSERAREKVLELASIMAEYTGSLNVTIVSLTHIQEELVKACEEDYFTLLLRRYMMAIATRIAKKQNCLSLVTGESLGQVASQTMEAMTVTEDSAGLPVFRPCIGLDKEEIVQRARAIGTFDVSIQPYEDCCTVFTPRHPRTKPALDKVLEQERKLDFDALVEEALESAYAINIKAKF